MTSDTLTAIANCLSYRDSLDAPGSIGAIGWEPLLQAAVELRLGPALVARLREKRAMPPIPPIVLPDGRRTVTAELELIWSTHLDRNRKLATSLGELVTAMNTAGLEPVLLKGAVSLSTGQPGWRSMRDIDLLLPGRDAERGHQVALRLGYRPEPNSTEKAGKHHFQPLFRDDLPGWVEIHQRAATHRAEGLLPTGVLLGTTMPVRIGTARARVFSPPARTLHAVIHHHVGHRGDKGGSLDLKGLFEFTADIAAMPQGEREALVALANRHPRLLATLDLWVAAAHALFGLPVEPPLTLAPDALARAAHAFERTAIPGPRYGGVGEEIAFASATARLRRLPSGGTIPGRIGLRARVLSSMFRPMINLFGDQLGQ